ncbi:MAG: N-acyl homoserine lactonase family protein [Clostridia bacterium]|nr:N-acyl homoserine lactonase family protein [Clostridia bacterium]
MPARPSARVRKSPAQPAAPKLKIHVLRCGKTGVDPAVLDRDISRNPLAYTGLFRPMSNRIWLPVRAYLIEHPKGRVLINTGWNPEVRNRPLYTLGPMLYCATPYLPVGESIRERLRALDLSPDMLDLVLLTHLESDAAGGLCEVRKAKKIAVHRDEWIAANALIPRYNVNSNNWQGIRVRTFTFPEPALGGQPETPYRDVFGDGSVCVVPLAGRTPGMVGVRVTWGGKFVLIVGDAAYFEDNWNLLTLPGPSFDVLDSALTLDYIRTQSKDPNCLCILASHDPAVQPDLIELGLRANFFYSGNRTNRVDPADKE